MKRQIQTLLETWKNKPNETRLPLVIFGARQVGKTYVVSEFASQNFKNFLYLNFEVDPNLNAFFDTVLDPKLLVSNIAAYLGREVNPDNTLLFFDEVQLCERALTSLKYFAEKGPHYFVVAAGSLLGVALNRERYSFPVGKIEMLHLYPLSFEEFLIALAEEQLLEQIVNSFQKQRALVLGLHNKCLQLFYDYLVVGGMPAAVNVYLKNRDMPEIKRVQQTIINAYLADMAKYASPLETVKIRTCFESIPNQLAKENQKFQYKMVKKGASTSYFGAALHWLKEAALIHFSYRVEHAQFPLATHYDLSAFKVFMCDTGLLSLMMKIYPEHLNFPERFQNAQFRGPLFENALAITLYKTFQPLYYWESQSMAELDFLIEIDGNVLPIEVKSGENVRSRSLSSFVNRYPSKVAYRISSKNFGSEGAIISIPHYASFLLGR